MRIVVTAVVLPEEFDPEATPELRVQPGAPFPPPIPDLDVELYPNPATDAGDQDGIFHCRIYSIRNSARVWMFSRKQPPRAVVLVWELASMTPRDFTQ